MERNQSNQKTKKKGGKRKDKEFVDIFGINNSNPDIQQDVDDERALTGEEKNLLKQFEENDQELEDIAGEICKALDEVKNVAEQMETVIGQQGDMTKNINSKAERNKIALNQQNNELKDIITRHKSGKQCVFDLSLLCVWLVLFGFTIKMFQMKGYI